MYLGLVSYPTVDYTPMIGLDVRLSQLSTAFYKLGQGQDKNMKIFYAAFTSCFISYIKHLLSNSCIMVIVS